MNIETALMWLGYGVVTVATLSIIIVLVFLLHMIAEIVYEKWKRNHEVYKFIDKHVDEFKEFAIKKYKEAEE